MRTVDTVSPLARLAALACLCAAAGGCASTARPAPARPAAATHAEAKAANSAPQAPVMGLLELPRGTDLRGVAAFANALRPGTGAAVSRWATGELPAVLAATVGARALSGVDLSQPIRVIVADPTRFHHPVAALVSVRDAAALTSSLTTGKAIVRRHLALVGSAKVVAALERYALGRLAAAPLPAAPRVTVFLRPLLASYKHQIASAKAKMLATVSHLGRASALAGRLVNALWALAPQMAQIEVSLATERDDAVIHLVTRAEPSSALARFFAVQSPSDFHLVRALPRDATGAVVAGHLVLGPARDDVRSSLPQVFHIMFGVPAPKRVTAAYTSWFDLFTGEMAIGFDRFAPGRMPKIAEVFGVTDGAKAKRLMDRLVKETVDASRRAGGVTFMGIHEHIGYAPRGDAERGVPVGVETIAYDLSRASAAQKRKLAALATRPIRFYLAGFDKLFAMASGDMHAVIDAARGAGPSYRPSAAVAARFAAARARNDSLVMVLDLGKLVGGVAPVRSFPSLWTVSLGFRGGAMHVSVVGGAP